MKDTFQYQILCVLILKISKQHNYNHYKHTFYET